MKTYLVLLLLTIAVFSCKKGQEDSKDTLASEIILTRSSSGYSDAALNRSSENSDPFDLKDVIISGDTVKITVSYSGGCTTHTFEVIWSETLSCTTPPQTGLIILHNSNGDMCEAYITETLVFNVSDMADGLSLDTLCVSVLNGWDPADSTSSGGIEFDDPVSDTTNIGWVFPDSSKIDDPGWDSTGNGWDPSDTTIYDDPGFDNFFRESDSCLVKVTAMHVICGTGLYNNLWFALEDSIGTGMENFYFRKYLQPVAIEKNLSGIVPVPGKKYILGARIWKDHDFLDIPVCLAYPGPSVPVKIMCINELE